MGENGILIGMESETLEACSPAQLAGHVEPLGFRIALQPPAPLHKHLQHMEQTRGAASEVLGSLGVQRSHSSTAT